MIEALIELFIRVWPRFTVAVLLGLAVAFLWFAFGGSWWASGALVAPAAVIGIICELRPRERKGPWGDEDFPP